ncbi:MAG: hypothetical protein ACPH3N_12555 [Alcanivorax sediminis]|uniref:Uncharacterized protein n=1 Tax=Alcanivorax sediminis TaxID=2663008 RepID=A0A6N7LXD5_9GAMM|nr:hypothetical protein [Alcanivorax sediminis]MQX52911.1 hypothetical protein [Alcanivorax sediminis]
MQIAEQILLLAGLAIVAFSYLTYWRRTGDARGVLMFWRKGMTLDVREFKLQRAGLCLLLVAVVLRFTGALV